MRVVMMLGSLGARSVNAAALAVAARHLGDRGHDVVHAGGLDLVPAFRAGQVDEPPASVAQLRTRLEDADAVLLAAPEYAGGVGGVTKNALDWLVGSASIYKKLFGVLSAGTTGGRFATEQLVRTLTWQGSLVVATLGIESPLAKMDDGGAFVHAETLAAIVSWADSVVDAHAADAQEVLGRVASVLLPYGIDPARFRDR